MTFFNGGLLALDTQLSKAELFVRKGANYKFLDLEEIDNKVKYPALALKQLGRFLLTYNLDSLNLFDYKKMTFLQRLELRDFT